MVSYWLEPQSKHITGELWGLKYGIHTYCHINLNLQLAHFVFVLVLDCVSVVQMICHVPNI